MSNYATEQVISFDGTKLAIHRLGQGRPVLMLHGLFSSAYMNWIDFGHAQALANAGFEAIMPDARAHGESGKPHNPGAYPHDVLIRDVFAIVDRLDLTDFDLAGFSLGARSAARAVLSGLTPRRLILAGMGLEGLSGWDRRGMFFIDAIDRFDQIRPGDPAYLAKGFMTRMRTDRVAARLLLESVGDIPREELPEIATPTLVLCGKQDRDNGSPQALAEALPNATYAEIPGTHMSSVTKPELGEAMARWLEKSE